MMQTSRWVGAASPRDCGHFIPAGRGAGRGPVYHHSTPTDSRRAFVRFVPCSRLPPPFLSSADGNALFFSLPATVHVGGGGGEVACAVPTGAVAPEAEGRRPPDQRGPRDARGRREGVCAGRARGKPPLPDRWFAATAARRAVGVRATGRGRAGDASPGRHVSVQCIVLSFLTRVTG